MSALYAIAATWGVNVTGPGPVAIDRTRDDLGRLFATLGYTRGAEIGVERGLYSETLLATNTGLHLTCVDAWAPYRGYREHVTAEKLAEIRRDMAGRLAPYSVQGRLRLLDTFSVAAAAQVEDRSLDFVYIDANHTLPHVVADLAAWVPKVRAGGIVAGHDYGRRSVGHVREAVQAWTTAYAIDPWFVLTGDRSPSWFWVTP